MATSQLSSFDEFQASLRYFFFLFRRPFTPALEEAARTQWKNLHDGDAQVKEDGQNNPLVELRLDPAFGQMLCVALADGSGKMPQLAVPRMPEQVSFWQGAAAGTMFPQAFEELSEMTSHFETIRQALAWHAGAPGAPGAPGGPAAQAPLRVCVLGASARYEYAVAVSSAQDLAERLAAVAEAAVPQRRVEFSFCGRDVPQDLHNKEIASSSGSVVTRHVTGYLHDLPAADMSGALFIALHSGMGLDHPELTNSWPPTLQRLRAAAPVSLVVSSFNQVEHETAERILRASLLTQLKIDVSGVNRAASLCGPDVVGPFEGIQGKRNYCVLHARILPAPQQQASDGWDLFD